MEVMFVTLNYEHMIKELGYDRLSDRVQILFNQWIKTPKAWLMSESDFEWISTKLLFNERQYQALHQAMKIIMHDNMLQEMLSFMQYVYMIGGHPSEWLMQKAPQIKHPILDSDTFQLMVILSLIPLARLEHQKRGIDEEHANFNLNHLKGYIKLRDEANNIYGIDNYGWTIYLASFGLIHIDTLNFMHHMYTDPYYFYQHHTSKEIIALAKSHIMVRKDGQINHVNQIDDMWFETKYEVSMTHVQGFRVNPMGSITDQWIELKLSEYTCILKPGDETIDFHIPLGVDYSVETFKSTLKKGKAFFDKHYASYDYKAFWCVSWLYSPQLTGFITNSASRIVQVAMQGYRVPATPGIQSLYTFVFGTEQPNLSTFEAKTSLQKAVKTYVSKNKSINAGCFIYFIDDVDAFGTRPYVSHNDEVKHQDIIV